MEWLDLEWSAVLGYATDSDHRSSLYVRLGLLTRRYQPLASQIQARIKQSWPPCL